MIDYSFEDEGLFNIKFTGELNLDEIKEFIQKFKTIDYLPPNLKVLYNFSEVTLKIKRGDIRGISTLADEATIKYESVKTAIVADKPMQTAFSILFTETVNVKKKRRKVFSTEIAAKKWLLGNH